VVAYLPVYRCDFVNYDDDLYVFANPHVQSGLSVQGLWWAFTTFDASNWHPLTWISLQLDCAIYGLKPAGFHVTNLFFHACNTVLLFLVLRRITGAMWPSAIVAALFGLHPLHVESVAWITERKDVLSTLFWVLTLAAFVRFIERPGLANYLLMFSLFALGLMAKPMLVTLPFVILLLNYWPLRLAGAEPTTSDTITSSSSGRSTSPPCRQPWFKLVCLMLPLFALCAASSFITLFAQFSGGAVQSFEQFPLASRLGNGLTAYVRYFSKTLWPWDLSNFYVYDLRNSLAWQVGAGLIMILLFALVLIQKQRRYLMVGFFWYVGTLVPVIGIVQVGLHSIADRYTYIPLVGLFIALVWGFAELLDRLQIPRRVRFGLAALVLLVAGMATQAQVRHWHDSVALWSHALEVDPDNYVAHTSLGSALSRQGKVEEAIRHYHVALEANSRDVLAHVNLASVLESQGQLKEAADHYLQALEARPRTAPWHYRAGVLLLAIGNSDAGIAQLSQALEIRPDSAQTHLALGEELAHRGKREDAERHLQQASRLSPRLPGIHYLCGLLLAERGMYEGAVVAYRMAIQRNPNNLSYHIDLAHALSKLKDRAASGEYQRALQLDPQFPKSLNRKAWMFATHPDYNIRDGARALRLAEQVCQATDFREPEFLDTLAAAHAELGHFQQAEAIAVDALVILRQQGSAQNQELEERLHLYHERKPFRTVS
jgi:tetratricopeptide (TPR) repeat protein